MSQPKTTTEIREAFLNFFESKNHARVQSSSLIPENDPTLLFVNAGMVPFKNLFLGLEKRDYVRATSAQKCVRAGGKHNDLENVGFTARHHTFFEMMGNFSFGDYFKEEALIFAWEFCTKVLKLDVSKLAVSVHESDEESVKIWKKISGLPDDRIFRFGDEDNFWQMGDTGPCGPCSEVFYDQGKEVDGERWLEFWNCVFMQYNRDESGTLHPLDKPCVDTGMGLERMATILQDGASNYDSDLLAKLILKTKNYIEETTSQKNLFNGNDKNEVAVRVIVDHLRSTSFLIADGVLPSNEGRGYVLRRILRRAVRFGKQLGLEKAFLYGLFTYLQEGMGEAYPELYKRETTITEILRQEEEKFFETLERGLNILDQAIDSAGAKILQAQVAFQLYDSFGFPLDLTELICRERGFTVDTAGFDKLMLEQQERSRKSWKGSGANVLPDEVKAWQSKGIEPLFIGYEKDFSESKVLAVHVEGDFTWASIDPCPFYAEGGGQVGDKGALELSDASQLSVIDTQKPYKGAYVLVMSSEDGRKLSVNQKLKALVNVKRRSEIRKNHSATHLLHAALRKYLGEHVQQAGSFLDNKRLRFDFSHGKAVTADELQKIESWVRSTIKASVPVDISMKSYDEAIKDGAMALFGEKYGDVVRVVKMSDSSVELCGGLHVSKSSEIGAFKILSEEGVAAGTRRIEAITSRAALSYYNKKEEIVKNLAKLLKTTPDQLEDRVKAIAAKVKTMESEISKAEKKMASSKELKSEIFEEKLAANTIKIHLFNDINPKLMRERGDFLRQTESEKVHVLWSDGQILVTQDPSKTQNFHSGKFLKELAGKFGGKGGGQDKTAQGRVKLPNGGIQDVLAWIREQK